jgi:hypothetical protein
MGMLLSSGVFLIATGTGRQTRPRDGFADASLHSQRGVVLSVNSGLGASITSPPSMV